MLSALITRDEELNHPRKNLLLVKNTMLPELFTTPVTTKSELYHPTEFNQQCRQRPPCSEVTGALSLSIVTRKDSFYAGMGCSTRGWRIKGSLTNAILDSSHREAFFSEQLYY
jgi:hypothetical protein